VSVVHGLLELLRIERPPLAAVNTPSIRQGRHTAITEARQPLLGAAQVDASFSSKGLERYALIKVPTHEAFPTDGCQSGQWVAMHGV